MRKVIRGSMKQQDAYKLLAAFLVFTMVGSVFAYIFIGARDYTAQETRTPETNLEKYNPEFWVVNQPFDSISDALKMTPPYAVSANYVDIESMTPQMVQWVRQEQMIGSLINDVDSKIYKSNTTKMYYAGLQNNSFLLLNTISPERNDFEYMVLPDTYPPILRRQDTGAINIMGNPIIYTNDKTASDVLGILYSLNKTATGYDEFEGLLNKADAAPFQEINSNVSFAKQFYMGIRETNGNYERTTVYLNLNSSALKKLDRLKANSTQNGFIDYYLNTSGNYTTVKISSPNMLKVLNEEIS